MTTRAAQPGFVSRDITGILSILLAGIGVVFLPTTPKLARESGSRVIATVIQLIAVLLLRKSLRQGSVCAVVLGARFMFEKLGRAAG